jgi:hypothetical protein
VKHRFGKASIKMYDKFAVALRIETTTNDVSFFKHHRKVEHRDGPPTRALAPVKKSIYSLIDLREGALTASGASTRFAARSCSAATGAISPTSPRSTTSPPASARSTA